MKRTYILLLNIFILLIIVFVAPMKANAYAIDKNDYIISHDTDYVVSEDYKLMPMPKAYVVKDIIINLGEEAGFFLKPEDLFIDDNNILYVADTGNNRVVKLDKDGNVISVFTDANGKAFNSPRGVYVDKDGDIYIADTENRRIVHLSPDGGFVEEFIKPDSALLEGYGFEPKKIFVDDTGYIYILNQSNYQGFMMIDADNQFRGYIGSTRVELSLQQKLIRLFATKEQKDKIAKSLAKPYSNFYIDKDGIIYATTITTQKDEIVKLNSVGVNIYKSDVYGFTYLDEDRNVVSSNFVDIAVDGNGIISVLESGLGRIHQYDQEGNCLTIFGGKGYEKGKFSDPSSIAVNSDGMIYVLDKEKGTIQIFEPTKFMKMIHYAVKLYADGIYEQAKSVWEEVLKIDSNYELAHRAIGKALVKQEQYMLAMDEYKKGRDPKGYSKAFIKQRFLFIYRNFTIVVIGFVAAIWVAYQVVKRLKNAADNACEELTDTGAGRGSK